jgi:hypothetical protein
MKEKEPNIKIVILQRGWVFVGEYSKKAEQCKLINSYNIRTWGTQKGLGELVSGPLPNTVLDYTGVTTFNELTTIAMIDCSPKWMEVLKLRQLAK